MKALNSGHFGGSAVERLSISEVAMPLNSACGLLLNTRGFGDCSFKDAELVFFLDKEARTKTLTASIGLSRVVKLG